MSNSRSLQELATELNKLADQQLGNIFRDLTDTSPDAEMSIIPLERKKVILAINIQTNSILRKATENLVKLTETSTSSTIESVRNSFEYLLLNPYKSVFSENILFKTRYHEILSALPQSESLQELASELTRLATLTESKPLRNLTIELNGLADKQLKDLLHDITKLPFEVVTNNLARLTKTSLDSEIQSSRNIFLCLLTNNKISQGVTADIIYKILLKLAELKPINDICFVSLDPIDPKEAIYASTGHQFDKTVLKDYFQRYGHKNPYSNQSFSERDIQHLKECTLETIPDLSPPLVSALFKALSDQLLECLETIENEIDLWNNDNADKLQLELINRLIPFTNIHTKIDPDDCVNCTILHHLKHRSDPVYHQLYLNFTAAPTNSNTPSITGTNQNSLLLATNESDQQDRTPRTQRR